MAKSRRNRVGSVRSRSIRSRLAYTPGIDISRHQGTIAWQKVAAAGVKYAYIKATEGASLVDAEFADNWKGTAQNKILRGAYHFFSPGKSPASQFQNFKKTVALQAGDLAPALDLEVDGQNWSALPPADRLPAALELLQLLEEHYGITPLVYTNKRTVDEVFNGDAGGLTSYPLWVASYKNSPPPTMPAGWSIWRYWQHSDKGTVDGITGAVDLNRCEGDPGPVLEEITPPVSFPRAALVRGADTATAAGRGESLAVFDHVWRSVHEESGRLFPQGIRHANVHLDLDVSGRLSVDIQIRGLGSALGGPTAVTMPFAAPAVAPPTAIDLSKPLSEKVPALWEIIGYVVADLDASSSAAKQRVIKTFLLHLAGHESQLRTRRQDAGGPARSLFQFEAHRAKDAGAHAQALSLMGKLAAASGNTAADLKAAITALPAFDPQNPGQSAVFPTGNLIEARFLDNDLFATFMARIDFKRFTAPIPETNQDQAEYWFKFWKGTAPDPQAAKQQFVANCAKVDPHIPT
jgi:lysozyme